MPRRKKTAKAQVPLRMPEPLRAKLERAAKDRGVSMNAEAIARLDDSFVNRDDLFGDWRMYALMRLVAMSIHLVEQETGKSFRDDPDTLESVVGAAETILRLYGAKGEARDFTASTLIGVGTTKKMIRELEEFAESKK